MTQDVVIPIDFGQGVDTKTDPKRVIASKFQLIKDGIFTNAKRITKRNGYDSMRLSLVGGGSISNPKMVEAYRDELVCAATSSSGNRLFSYSSSLSGWVDKGKYESIAVSKSIINTAFFSGTGTDDPVNDYGVCNTSCAVSGNIALYAFDGAGMFYGKNFANGGCQASYITVVDLSTGTQLLSNHVITNALGFSKAIVIGTSTLAVFYISSLATDRLSMRVISVSLGGSVSIGSEVTIGPCQSFVTMTRQFPYNYDVSANSSGAIVVAGNAGNVDIYKINTAGATTATASILYGGDVGPISVNVDSSSQAWIYWTDAGRHSYYSVVDSSLATVTAQTTISTLGNIAGFIPVIRQICGLSTSSTTQNVYVSAFVSPSSHTTALNAVIYKGAVNTSGSVSVPARVVSNLELIGKPFTYNSTTYLPTASYSVSGATGFIIDTTDYLPVAKFLQGSCAGVYSSGYTVGGSSTPASFISARFTSFLVNVGTLSSTTFLVPSDFVVSSAITEPTGSTNLDLFPTEAIIAVYMGSSGITIDFDNIDAKQSRLQQDTLVMNGSIVSMYDGAGACELGFLIDPDNITYIPGTSAGSIPAGTYVFYVTYAWTDANGRLYESAPSAGTTIVITSGSTNDILIRAPSLTTTQKSNVVIKVWRSDSNQGGNIAYLVATSNNSSSSVFNDITVTLSSSAAITNPTLYTQNSAILENIAPPPSMILWANDNRLWAVDSENPETTIDYTKTATPGYGISFSTGQLQYIVDSRGGAITGASPMDEKTVLLKEKGLGYFIGDGSNDAGTGSTLSSFQFIPSDAGCTNSKSVILYPSGVLYRTNKGIYQLSRGLQTSYFGVEVESYNSQDIVSAHIVSNKNQIRFLTSSGYSLLYDYVFNQWSVFTNHAGLSATDWGGQYTYVRTDGAIYTENATSFLDNTNSYSLILQTAWLALSSVQNFQRAKQVLPLGDYQNGSSAGHGIQIQCAYDFSPTFGTAVPYYFGSASSSGVFQYRNFFSQQKCDSVSLLISEITTGASGEYIDLTNMSFVAGLKKGTNKLSPARSVG